MDVNSGNLIVSEKNGNFLRIINSTGYVRTLAFTSVAGTSDGPALRASGKEFKYMDIDDWGTIYVSESGKSVIRAVYDKATLPKSQFYANDNWECFTGYCIEAFAGKGWPGYTNTAQPLLVSY